MDSVEPTAGRSPLGTPLSIDSLDADRVLAAVTEELLGRATPPSTVGRFEIEARIGAGGMGVVYAAHDPNLDRRVALKMLRGTFAGDDAAPRLRREAQAMARLSHPNVVTVYEVGELDGRVYIAMEYVDGCTLTQWLRMRPRSWRDVLGAFAQAGRGLAAAHELGVVHRDFKPDNVLVHKTGSVRVADFGLARAGDSSELDERVPTSGDDKLTRTGAVMGTPAYMAPEQHRGQRGDALSDQFSFCVALFEALWGERPFPGRTPAAIAACVMSGEPPSVPPRPRVPKRVRRALLRGLARDPGARWPSMTALLAELDRELTAPRRRWLALGLATLTGAAIAIAAAELGGTPICGGARDRVHGIWDVDRRDAVRTALLATDLPFAASTADTVERELDGYVDAWVAAYTDACEATHVRGEQSVDRLDARMGCLDRRLVQLGAQVEVLTHADVDVVESAVVAVSFLPRVEPCRDADALLAEVPPPEDIELARAVADVREGLALVDANVHSGRPREVLERAHELVTRAETSAYPPVLAEALLAHGLVLAEVGEYESAQQVLERAVWIAVAHRHDRVVAGATVELVSVLGDKLRRFSEADRWRTHADAVITRLGDREQRAMLSRAAGLLELRRGDLRAALADDAQALAIARELHGGDHYDVGIAVVAVAGAERELGDIASARTHYLEGIAILERSLGAEHPRVATAHHNFGTMLQAVGERGLAMEHLQRALEIRESIYGGRHAEIARTLTAIGVIAAQEGRVAEARADLDRALEIADLVLPPGHPTTISVMENLAGVLTYAGEPAEAERLLERVVAARRTDAGNRVALANALLNLAAARDESGHRDAAITLAEEALRTLDGAEGAAEMRAVVLENLGTWWLELDRAERADAYLREALALREAVVGVDHPSTAPILGLLAEAAHVEHQDRRAIELVERANRIAMGADLDRRRAANLAWITARALWASPAQRGRAQEFAMQARDAFAALGPGNERHVAAVNTWLQHHELR